MFQAVKPINQGRVSKPATIVAPTGGWYVYDNLAAMPPGTAYILDNWFPGKDYVRLRKGTANYATGMGSSTKVQTLIPYSNGATEKLFAVTSDGKFYDVTSAGAVGAATISGLSNGRWQYTAMTTTGGSYVIALNGADDGRIYDGSTWTTTSITGVTEASCNSPFVYNRRLYIIEDDSMSIWYLSVDSISGAATEFPMGGIFRKGGKIIAGASWSLDVGNGLDEVLIVVTSEGEVGVYTGTYPGDTATWALHGVYTIGKPLGRRCLLKIKGDILVLTENGVVALSQATRFDEAALKNESLTKAISPEYRRITSARLALDDDWQMVSWATENEFILNVPLLDGTEAQQLVANSYTGAWCRYTGWDAACWVVFGDNLYYGSKVGTVVQAETQGSDNGAAYVGTMFWSFSDLGAATVRKHMRLARSNLQSNFIVSPKLTFRTDYRYDIPPDPSVSAGPTGAAKWDAAVWDTSRWETELPVPYAGWRSTTGTGTMIAPVLQVATNTTEQIDLRVTSLDVVFELGNDIG